MQMLSAAVPNKSLRFLDERKKTLKKTLFEIPFVVCEASSDTFRRRQLGRSRSLLRMKQAWAETKLHARSDV